MLGSLYPQGSLNSNAATLSLLVSNAMGSSSGAANTATIADTSNVTSTDNLFRTNGVAVTGQTVMVKLEKRSAQIRR